MLDIETDFANIRFDSIDFYNLKDFLVVYQENSPHLLVVNSKLEVKNIELGFNATDICQFNKYIIVYQKHSSRY